VQRGLSAIAEHLVYFMAPPRQYVVYWCQDTSDPGHFGPKTFRHHEIGAEMTGQIGTSAELSRGHLGTGTKLSRPPANVFATVGHTEERFNITRCYY